MFTNVILPILIAASLPVIAYSAFAWHVRRLIKRGEWYCHHDQPCYCGRPKDPDYDYIFLP